MKTIVVQSFRTERVPSWIETALASVRAWAERSGFEYRFMGDAFFDYAPAWVRERCGSAIFPVTDIARLYYLQDMLAAGYERAVWADADVLVFDAEHLVLERGQTFCHEQTVGREADGRLHVLPAGVNNAFMVFERGDPALANYLAAALHALRSLPPQAPIPRCVLGPDLLSAMGLARQDCINTVGLFTASLMEEIAVGGGPLTACYMGALGTPLAAANLCHFNRHQADAGLLDYLDTVWNSAVSRLLDSRGGVVNGFLPAAPQAATELAQQAVAAMGQGNYPEALRLGLHILAAEPENDVGLHLVGLSYLRSGFAADAATLLQKVAERKPYNPRLHWQLGQALLELGQPLPALNALDRAASLGVVERQLRAEQLTAALGALQSMQAWSEHARLCDTLRNLMKSRGYWVVGEHLLARFDDAAVLRRAAENHGAHVMSGLEGLPSWSYRKVDGRIRLGFLGSDFDVQATAYLMVGFIEALDRSRFEVVAYDHGGPRPDSVFRRRVHAAYDRVVDIAELSDEQAAARIHADGIDVLFSIKNPASARLGLLARRPAPVQVNYLYYPGTSGMPFLDYIIADEFVVPAGAEAGYSERVLRLPGCYQPNDPMRPRAADTRREQWGLPADAVVLANFSQTYKYTPAVFALWCELLRRDSRRILWLLSESAEEQASVRREAAGRGIDAGRLYFGPKLDTPGHLDRLRHADLIVDTFPYGGHTLTSDALWAGTPVLTLCGETFASRVAASLLHAVGLDELIASSDLEYLDKGDALLRDADARQRWRQHLDSGRRRFPLFDSAAYAARFEKLVLDLVAARPSV